MKSMKVLFCTAVLASGALAVTQSASAAAPDVSGPRANIGLNHVLTGLSSSITGGEYNTNKAHLSVIAGGHQNMIETNSNDYTVISGGADNIIFAESYYSVIAGGRQNEIGDDARQSVIGGGQQNVIRHDSYAGWIGGGLQMLIDKNSPYVSIGGGGAHTISTNSAYATISGGGWNTIGYQESTNVNILNGSTIAGGWFNVISNNSALSTISGGRSHLIHSNSVFSTIAGGADNCVRPASAFATIAGGFSNTNLGNFSTVGGGDYNLATAENATVAGGHINTASGIGASVVGGTINLASSYYATVAGGGLNVASGITAFAAGWRAKANHDGALVWADYTDLDIASTNAHSVTMRAGGGYRLFSNSGASQGVYLAPGGGSWTTMSDRNAKENIQPVNNRAVLEKVAALPVSTWNYKAQAEGVRHMGPMAQDFKAAFGVGETETGITSVDADGVALAAIQGLYEMLREKESRLQDQATQLKEIQKELKAIKEGLAK